MADDTPACYDCRSYRLRTEFGHEQCLDHRPCYTHRGYVPTLCVSCSDNCQDWEPMSHMMFGWRRCLSMNSRRLGGEDCWAYRDAFPLFGRFRLALHQLLVAFLLVLILTWTLMRIGVPRCRWGALSGACRFPLSTPRCASQF